MSKVTVFCKRCKKEFQVKQCRKERSKYCSLACCKNVVKINCLTCQKEFCVQKHREKTAKYCSKKCSSKTLKICLECGCKYTSHSYAKYCSLKCRNLAGKKNPQYLTWLRNAACSLSGKFNSGKFNAKVRGIPWMLSKAEYSCLVGQKCFYCKKPVNVLRGVGLDRKDNSKPYTLDNVVACCTRCNYVKNKFFSFEEMLLIAKTIRRIDKKREKSVAVNCLS